MKKTTIFIVLLSMFLLILSAKPAFAAESDNLPLTIQLDESNGELSDYFDITFEPQEIVGTHIGIKLNVQHAMDSQGRTPIWNMFKFEFYDSDGNVFRTTQPNQYTTSSPDYVPAVTETGIAIDVVWGYSHLWPLLDFYGTIYIPWHKTNSGSDSNPTVKPSNISKIRIGTNTKSNSRKEVIANLFEVVDATFVSGAVDGVKWIGDVKVLHDFELKGTDYSLEKHGTILDFTLLKPTSEQITFSQDAKLYARKMAQVDYDNLITLVAEYTDLDAWKSNYSTSGQPFDYSYINNGEFGKSLKWTYGSYLLEYDSKLNSYGSLAISVATDDWRGALGMTMWVKNPQNYPVSFNFEFSEAESGGAERWNLNSVYYKQIYAYDTNTKEEYAFNTRNVLFLPANFEGWVRIPFSQYDVPSWSMAYEWTDGILDLCKPHKQIWITSQFVINDGVTMYFDNLGLYYGDFQVGKLFDREKPSIKERLETPFVMEEK